MTNFKCVFCDEKMEIPKELRGKINPVTNVFWHENCPDNPEFGLNIEQKIFWAKQGTRF